MSSAAWRDPSWVIDLPFASATSVQGSGDFLAGEANRLNEVQGTQTLLARTGITLLKRNAVPTVDVRQRFAGYITDWLTSVTVVEGRP